VMAEKEAKIKVAKERELENLRKRNDSVINAKAQQDALAKIKNQNTISETQKEQQKLLIEKRRYDSIVKVREQESKQLMELRRKNDSISRIIDQERKELESIRNNRATAQETINTNSNSEEDKRKKALLERMKFRDSCHYQINEYDKFYNITTIRTEPYSLGNNLTVELYKQGRKENVFFNYKGDLGCASYLPNQRSTVKVTLEDNRTIAFYHSWDIECGDTFLFKASLSINQIEILKKSPIKSIIIRGTEGYKEINFIEYKEFFMDKLKCIQ
ncbi:hypothetical protein, partial [Algibacter sp.]|uniref:hypothetical protein n=1 Tax=Algibacter sp. TaxID=1872428 RepID=UPI003C789818